VLAGERDNWGLLSRLVPFFFASFENEWQRRMQQVPANQHRPFERNPSNEKQASKSKWLPLALPLFF
jgi:hypothetical protein